MDKKTSNSILDVGLFKRLMAFVKPYRKTFVFVLLAAVFLSGFSTLSPYLLKITIDDYITEKDYDGMLVLIAVMGAALILEVVFQFMFIYFANWLGQQLFLICVTPSIPICCNLKCHITTILQWGAWLLVL